MLRGRREEEEGRYRRKTLTKEGPLGDAQWLQCGITRGLAVESTRRISMEGPTVYSKDQVEQCCKSTWDLFMCFDSFFDS